MLARRSASERSFISLPAISPHVELEAAHRITPNEVAATFAKILRNPVRAETVPRERWASLFKSQGMNPTPRIQMLGGFNGGWIEFERGESASAKGSVILERY
jgi:NAD(P)H dehydrogenase (quinone)